MIRVSFVFLAAVVACGPKAKPTNLAPLPDDKPVVADTKPAEPATKAETPPEAPAAPLPPLEVTIPASKVTVKLVSAGKGKRAPLRFTAKPGAKQAVELAMDFALKQTVGAQSQDTVIPTVVLIGNAEATAVDKDGKAEYAFTTTAADAREVAGNQVPVDKFKKALASLSGLVITSNLGANGASGDVKMRIEKPDDLSVGAVDMVRLTLPSWPALPKEAVGVGAKWQATTTARLADKVDITQVTDYELVAHKGPVWTIKGTTKVSGADHDTPQGKISKITGKGSSEITLADGALYPTSKSTLATEFTASEKTPDGEVSANFVITVGGTVTAK